MFSINLNSNVVSFNPDNYVNNEESVKTESLSKSQEVSSTRKNDINNLAENIPETIPQAPKDDSAKNNELLGAFGEGKVVGPIMQGQVNGPSVVSDIGKIEDEVKKSTDEKAVNNNKLLKELIDLTGNSPDFDEFWAGVSKFCFAQEVWSDQGKNGSVKVGKTKFAFFKALSAMTDDDVIKLNKYMNSPNVSSHINGFHSKTGDTVEGLKDNILENLKKLVGGRAKFVQNTKNLVTSLSSQKPKWNDVAGYLFEAAQGMIETNSNMGKDTGTEDWYPLTTNLLNHIKGELNFTDDDLKNINQNLCSMEFEAIYSSINQRKNEYTTNFDPLPQMRAIKLGGLTNFCDILESVFRTSGGHVIEESNSRDNPVEYQKCRENLQPAVDNVVKNAFEDQDQGFTSLYTKLFDFMTSESFSLDNAGEASDAIRNMTVWKNLPQNNLSAEEFLRFEIGNALGGMTDDSLTKLLGTVLGKHFAENILNNAPKTLRPDSSKTIMGAYDMNMIRDMVLGEVANRMSGGLEENNPEAFISIFNTVAAALDQSEISIDKKHTAIEEFCNKVLEKYGTDPKFRSMVFSKVFSKEVKNNPAESTLVGIIKNLHKGIDVMARQELTEAKAKFESAQNLTGVEIDLDVDEGNLLARIGRLLKNIITYIFTGDWRLLSDDAIAARAEEWVRQPGHGQLVFQLAHEGLSGSRLEKAIANMITEQDGSSDARAARLAKTVAKVFTAAGEEWSKAYLKFEDSDDVRTGIATCEFEAFTAKHPELYDQTWEANMSMRVEMMDEINFYVLSKKSSKSVDMLANEKYSEMIEKYQRVQHGLRKGYILPDPIKNKDNSEWTTRDCITGIFHQLATRVSDEKALLDYVDYIANTKGVFDRAMEELPKMLDTMGNRQLGYLRDFATGSRRFEHLVSGNVRGWALGSNQVKLLTAIKDYFRDKA